MSDLALILVVAGAVTLLFKKLRQPLVLGYIVAGFLVSPHMPYTMSVVDKGDVEMWAEIGVMFLLFSLGLDFSVKKILKMGTSPVIAACTIVFSMILLGITVGKGFGWGHMDCIFLGGMLAMSSTTIIYKALSDMGLLQQGFVATVMSVCILEDILAIVMMVMLSAIANGSSPDGGQLLGSVFKIGFFLVLWFVIGIFLIPLLLRKVRKLMNAETLLIVALGLCCLMAVYHVAIVGRNDGHLRHQEVLVHDFKCCCRSSSSCRSNTGCGFEAEIAACHKDSVHERDQSPVGRCKVNRGADDEAVRSLHLVQHLIDRIVVKYAATVVLGTSAAANTSADGLLSNMKDFRLHAFFFQCVSHFLQCSPCTSLFIRASVNQQYFHLFLLLPNCKPGSNQTLPDQSVLGAQLHVMTAGSVPMLVSS